MSKIKGVKYQPNWRFRNNIFNQKQKIASIKKSCKFSDQIYFNFPKYFILHIFLDKNRTVGTFGKNEFDPEEENNFQLDTKKYSMTE